MDRYVGLGLCLLIIGATGCTSAKTTNTARTSTEQLLISNAIDGALDKVNFAPFAGATVFVDEKYVDGVDSKYLIASVRHRIAMAGGRTVDSRDDADVLVELRTGGIGTVTSESFIGTPEIALPGALTLPEMRVIERSRQSGTAKIGLVAYDNRTREILGTGGITLAEADDNNWFVAGVGPWRQGTVKEEIQTRTAVNASFSSPRIPAQVAFEGAKPINPQPDGDAPANDVQYASVPLEPRPEDRPAPPPR